eukprot:CAMPEP_0174582836 /NCGR_PEP_ID=MMETSP0929-20130131/10535_1 /TAXON_ID=548131 ORGANISM="Ostreococcus mediterraneus, Strain clade-D-RCC2572" /NCGR_SAMPLE_ID=MMETSP0929 /ASSEMBLY_ACC=CAM_ASM_000573 /LENGTH=32 /DNA_ID= /DNA_START= /DNA_END= /DNA_ORIENTATION=
MARVGDDDAGADVRWETDRVCLSARWRRVCDA